MTRKIMKMRSHFIRLPRKPIRVRSRIASVRDIALENSDVMMRR